MSFDEDSQHEPDSPESMFDKETLLDILGIIDTILDAIIPELENRLNQIASTFEALKTVLSRIIDQEAECKSEETELKGKAVFDWENLREFTSIVYGLMERFEEAIPDEILSAPSRVKGPIDESDKSQVEPSQKPLTEEDHILAELLGDDNLEELESSGQPSDDPSPEDPA